MNAESCCGRKPNRTFRLRVYGPARRSWPRAQPIRVNATGVAFGVVNEHDGRPAVWRDCVIALLPVLRAREKLTCVVYGVSWGCIV